MRRHLVTTADGSHSLQIEDWDEQYHSKHGAVAESLHVFIEKGLQSVSTTKIYILEMGFGTGLNALMSLIDARQCQKYLHYTALEAFPLKKSEWEMLNYPEILNEEDLGATFQRIHESPWEDLTVIDKDFHLLKHKTDMRTYSAKEAFDLIYFDAFGYRVQPELWSPEVFENMYKSLKTGGILVTYAAKGVVRRTMQEVGFRVERLPGPPGKREMLRAQKY